MKNIKKSKKQRKEKKVFPEISYILIKTTISFSEKQNFLFFTFLKFHFALLSLKRTIFHSQEHSFFFTAG